LPLSAKYKVTESGDDWQMRAGSLLVVVLLSSSLLVGFQLLSPSTKAFTLVATVDIKPETLNLNMKGKWITAYISLPEGYNITDIDPATILLEGLFGPEWSNIEDGRLMVKFDASNVIDYLWDRLYHMVGKRGSIELRVAGQLVNTTQFSGTDTITIIKPV